jgi:hypothetical protein
MRTRSAGCGHRHRARVRLGALIAAVARRLEFLEAGRAPAHRPRQLARGMRADDVFRMHERLHAEAATDIADDDAHPLGCQAEQLSDRALESGRILRARVNESPRFRVESATAARFQRHRRDALVVDRDADDLRRRRECAVTRGSVTITRAAGDVAAARARRVARDGASAASSSLPPAAGHSRPSRHWRRTWRRSRDFGEHHRHRLPDEADHVERRGGKVPVVSAPRRRLQHRVGGTATRRPQVGAGGSQRCLN